MNYDYPQTMLSRTVLTGVFAGIIATCINLTYDFIYRGIGGFALSEIINVPSIIFMTMLLFTIAGLIYFFLARSVKRGNLIYMVIFGVLTLLCFYMSLHVTRSNNAVETEQFRVLLSGSVAISGLLLVFLIPYLSKHDKFYN